MRLKLLSTAAMLGLLAAGLGGCTGGAAGPDQRAQVVAGLAVEVAALRFVEQHPEHGERMAVVAEIAAMAIGSGEAATVAAAKAVVERHIRWDRLAPSQRLLVQALVDLVAADLAAVAPDGLLPTEARGRAAVLLEAVARAGKLAMAAGAKPSGFEV